jgi:hypothetical protein
LRASAVPAKKKRDFDPRKFLATIGEGRKVVAFPRKQTIFTQGDASDAVFYIQEGKVEPCTLLAMPQSEIRSIWFCKKIASTRLAPFWLS